MMSLLLAELLSLLSTELIDTPISGRYALRTIHLLNSAQMDQVRAHHYPCLIIMAASETHDPGQFANTARQKYRIDMIVCAESCSLTAYKVDQISGTADNMTIYNITDKIREILYQNKKLVSSTFEMEPEYSASPVRVSGSGKYDYRQVTISYTRLEYYTGMQNDQSHLTPAYQL